MESVQSVTPLQCRLRYPWDASHSKHFLGDILVSLATLIPAVYLSDHNPYEFASEAFLSRSGFQTWDLYLVHDVIANVFTYLDADTVIHGTEGQHCNNKWVARKCPKNFAPRLLFLVISCSIC